MANEIKMIYDTCNETIRINLNGETIHSIAEREIEWQEKKDNARHWVLLHMFLSGKPYIYCEAWF